MKSFVSRSAIPAFKPLVSLIAFTIASPAFAQTSGEATLAPVVVTTSRFASDSATLPIGASVITSEEIRSAGINNVNEAVRKLGGVYGRQSTFGFQDFDLDLRGFGATSAQNVVILVDGVRLSENELSTAVLSSVPIESVERIEIARGGRSVLYGDGATGGVINVITKRGRAIGVRGSVTAEAGTLGERQLRASVARTWDNFALDANAGAVQADNYRDNNEIRQKNFNGGLQWFNKDSRFGLRVESSSLDARLPGGLSLADFEQNPRRTRRPQDYGVVDTDRYSAFAEHKFGAWEAAAELSHRNRTTLFGADGSPASVYKGRQSQFSPRLRHMSDNGGLSNELVLGLDFLDWTRDVDSSFSRQKANQKSRAVYARDEIKTGNARIAFGARHETFDKDSFDPSSGARYDVSQSLNAWELEGSYNFTKALSVFAKAGRSYRVANVDEISPTSILKPQTSNDLELGGTVGDANRKLTLRLFRHQLRNEIYYDPTVAPFGANVNLDPTRRQGLEVEASARLNKEFRIAAQWQHVRANFTEGVNSGREIALVPKNTLSMRLTWLPSSVQTADIGVQWVDTQRYGGDFSNACTALIPSVTTVDARYARRFGAWELAVAGTNLTDRDYFSNAFSCRGGIYPSNGRQLKLSARYDF